MTDPACASAVAALEHDPFYRCISAEFSGSDLLRRGALARYFDYSIRQGALIGRVVHAEQAHAGVAVWTLPQRAAVQECERSRKQEFLDQAIGERGRVSYERIVAYMSARAATEVGPDAWYLSIVAVAPEMQGQGLGARLLAPTLAEADAAGTVCYLETFNLRSLRFYARMGFDVRAAFDEPTTRARYTLMVRAPRAVA